MRPEYVVGRSWLESVSCDRLARPEHPGSGNMIGRADRILPTSDRRPRASVIPKNSGLFQKNPVCEKPGENRDGRSG